MRSRTFSALGTGLLLLLLVGSGCSSWPPARDEAVAAAARECAPFPAAPRLARWRARQDLAAREYWASAAPGSLQAPNRAHDLRIAFEPTGIRVHERAAARRRLLGVSLARMGRTGTPLAQVEPGVVWSARERVEIRRAGLVEWYRNSADGLEQGFDLAAPPEGRGDLVLELAIRDAAASAQGEDLVFRSSAGRRLAYGRLEARDAAGRSVPARLEAPDAQRVRLVVEDAEALYPLTIDPLLTQSADARLESDQPEANFGISVAGAGDVNGDGYDDVIVGALRYAAGQANEGLALVFRGSRDGIVASGDPTNADTRLESNLRNAFFGGSVAGAGDVNGDGHADVIVAASGFESSAAETDEGAAFVFLGSRAGIANADAASADARLESDQLGALLGSAAGAGDVDGDGYDDVIVAANYYDAPDTNEGAAFVFLGSVDGIADGNPLTADSRFESDQARSFFGSSVAAGDFNGDGYSDVVIGGGNYDAPETNEGAAFVFLGSREGLGDGTPRTADAVFDSNQAGAFFGEVASAGDVAGDRSDDLIVGAHTYGGGELNEGAVFLFLGSRAGLQSGNPATAAARIESNQQGGDLGAALASAGDVDGDRWDDIIVGAPLYEDGELGEGAAFVYLGGPGASCSPGRDPRRDDLPPHARRPWKRCAGTDPLCARWHWQPPYTPRTAPSRPNR